MPNKNSFTEIVYFTKKERLGLYLFVILMLTMLMGSRFLQSFHSLPSGNEEKIAAILKEWKVEKAKNEYVPSLSNSAVERQSHQKQDKSEIKTLDTLPDSMNKLKRFNFDPNTLSRDSLQILGFTSKTAHIIDKYRSKGGQFRQDKDLEKIYGINPKLLKSLAPYIQTTQNRHDGCS